ncbi:MAG: glycogen/starch/alpha-glucan phosphorylase [Methylobacteriaceae bacterium]|jgi:starch phosphorylase|nr:glycogen/starch/alpha-glucan phosphorylase [Methylobacteriaceae bacterium]
MTTMTKTTISHDFVATSIESLKESIARNMVLGIGQDPEYAVPTDWLNAVILTVRDHMVEEWINTRHNDSALSVRRVYYLSMEYLIGRTLSNALIATGMYAPVKQALAEMGQNLEELCELEADPGLGNGGLGRLAACFLDSMATLDYQGWGYGLRYEYGMFRQRVVDGRQMEMPDNWLKHGNKWEFLRDNIQYTVRFGGRLERVGTENRWVDTEKVAACAYDQIIPGYKTTTANTLRLWSARAYDEMDLQKFNRGNYSDAIASKALSESITSVLYPEDSTDQGKTLRLKQEYFLVSATIQDIVRRHFKNYHTVSTLADKVAIHLNDTHPVLAIPELIRVLTEDYQVEWADAWEMTKKIFSYTTHPLLSEALEAWPVDLMNRILPLHLQIIYRINFQFLEECRARGFDDGDFIRRVSIIDENFGRRVRMAWLAAIASHKINGVSKLHSELMVKSLFADFAALYPERFTNVTNGVTPRRWIAVANPGLASLIDDTVGGDWRRNLDKLEDLKKYADDAAFLGKLAAIKRANKERLAGFIKDKLDIDICPDALFDMQIKRIHEYKRQTLNLLQVIVRYNEIIEHPDADWVPKVVFFAGKAASGYAMAKGIIEIINDVAVTVNNDHRVNDLLKVVFVPDYSVSIAEMMIPACDLSEQISLAGYEASGTSNMKFVLNGALIIGTLDGANIEIKERVGDANIFTFGHDAEEVIRIRNNYNQREYYEHDKRLSGALTQIAMGYFSKNVPSRFGPFIMSNYYDYYQVFADFASYYDAQKRVDVHYCNPTAWSRSALMNIASTGIFSTDRTIREYAENIWNIQPLKWDVP